MSALFYNCLTHDNGIILTNKKSYIMLTFVILAKSPFHRKLTVTTLHANFPDKTPKYTMC